MKDFILVVDDEPRNLQLLGNLLREEGYETAFATNGSQALRSATQRRPDLILLDVMMPEMDGYEVCTQIKADRQTADVPIIFLTAKVERESVVRGFQTGAVDYVTKPCNSEELLARVRTHLELKHARDQLNDLAARRTKFLTILAQDIRNPFGETSGFLQGLIDHGDNLSWPELQEYLGHSLKQAERTEGLLNQLLDWALGQIQKTNFPVSRSLFPLKICAESVLKAAAPYAEAKNIVLELEMDPKLKVWADMNVMVTVLKNLLGNAVKFSASGSMISLQATDQKEGVEISVVDTGSGMTQEQLESALGDASKRNPTRGTEGEKGMGIGLLLCKQFVEAHGGALMVESEPGKGTRARFVLPHKAT
jgi:two-component system sensor histidine kinase/response regulator